MTDSREIGIQVKHSSDRLRGGRNVWRICIPHLKSQRRSVCIVRDSKPTQSQGCTYNSLVYEFIYGLEIGNLMGAETG